MTFIENPKSLDSINMSGFHKAFFQTEEAGKFQENFVPAEDHRARITKLEKNVANNLYI